MSGKSLLLLKDHCLVDVFFIRLFIISDMPTFLGEASFKRNLLFRVPLMLTLLRAALAPVLVVLASFPSPAGFALCLITAFLSDVFDGKIARRLGIATPNLRRLDSMADTIFYVAAVYCLWKLHPGIIVGNAVPLLILLALEIGRYVFDLLKFGKEASYHMWSSKLWGAFLFLGFFSALVFGKEGLFVHLAIYAGLLADVEGLMISVVLPYWKNDVPTIVHALRIRSENSGGD